MVERRYPPDLLTFVRINDAGDLEPEIDETRENSRVLMHYVDWPRPAGCVSALTPVGWTLVYKLRDNLASSEPFPDIRIPSQDYTRRVIQVTMRGMERLVDGRISYATQPDPTRIVESVAGCIMYTLVGLQTVLTGPSRWLTCLCCRRPAVPAPRMCSRAYKLEVQTRSPRTYPQWHCQGCSVDSASDE